MIDERISVHAYRAKASARRAFMQVLMSQVASGDRSVGVARVHAPGPRAHRSSSSYPLPSLVPRWCGSKFPPARSGCRRDKRPPRRPSTVGVAPAAVTSRGDRSLAPWPPAACRSPSCTCRRDVAGRNPGPA
jgi:hypothetical protein